MNAIADLALQLRAAADERRLRLLQLCADGPASVSALAAALADSEPNVSRQLKQLAVAGLVRRSRQGQFVEYSLAAGPGVAARMARWLLDQLGVDDAALCAARHALQHSRSSESVRIAAVRGLEPPSRFGRTLATALESPATIDAAGRRVLLRGRYPELAAMLANVAGELALVTGSNVERAAVRRWAAARGLEVEVDLLGAFVARAPARRWDLVVFDDAPAPRAGTAGLEADLALSRRLLGPQGRAWVTVDYDALEALAAGSGAPPQRLRGLMLAAGLTCQELLPVEAEGRHVLVGRSQPLRGAATLARSA
jgi:DNA-binding transcriptional ArsR family regulator